MAIYRGPGGAGDATGDATNASALALAAKNEAQASATSAASSATAAASSATSAASSATDAATSATNAAGSATTASTAATNASTYATNAASSATTAASEASNAASSATAASTSASSASSSASAASTSASNASTSATNASNSASSASTSASEAAASAASISNRVISVTDNTNAALRITQLGTGNALLVEDSTNPDATPFVIDASGLVITGYTSSQTLAGAAYQFQMNSGAPWAGVRWNAASTGPTSLLAKSRSATVGTNSIVLSGDAVGSLAFAGDDGTQFVQAASITAAVDGTPGTNDMPGRLVFSTTADGASSPTERMRINNAGNVGIGSASLTNVSLRLSKNIAGATSSYNFYNEATVQSDVTTTAYANRTALSTAAAAFTLGSMVHYGAQQVTIGAGSTVNNQFGFFADSSLTGATTNFGFYGAIAAGTGRYNFYAAGTAVNYFAGNVGVGNTTPAYKVDVTGDVNITGNFYKNGTIFSGGAKGGGSDAVFYENDQTVSTNYTITSGKSAMSTGPISVSSGVSVTIPSGSRWVVL